MNHPSRTPSLAAKQRGAAFLVMIVILVLGIATVLVSALSSAALKSARDQRTADVLAQAKDALISRAATDNNRPGSLPCPDINDDGSSEGGATCTSYVGRLPWKTLGLPDLRDSSGERLWYALSTNFRDAISAPPLNSETNGLLTVTSGTLIQNGVIAIVFSSGNAYSGQDRSTTATTTACTIPGIPGPTNNLCVGNYLEGTNATSTSNFQSSATGIDFNDQLITITRSQLFPTVEMRIAREAKNCLDDYATANGHRYPWAADPAITSFNFSQVNTRFGRLPKYQTPDNNVQNLINQMNALQTAVTNCANGVGSQSTLSSVGNALETAANTVQSLQPTTPPIPAVVTNNAATAGEKAVDGDVTCTDIQAAPTGNDIQTSLTNAAGVLNSSLVLITWPASCTLFGSLYWPDWSNQIFYQVDTQYSPSGGLGSPTITINGAGSYRAAVIMARSPIPGQTRVPTDPTTYLEGTNQHTNPAPSPAFTSNSISSPGYQSVNDLVLCLDDKVTCK